MSILELIAAFGGGLFGAAIGGLPAFIITGVLAIAGGVAQMSGADASAAINYIAFGSFLGPHIAFAGGVAASAFAHRKGLTDNGADIGTPLNGLMNSSVLLVGGLFGVIGYLIKYFYQFICHFGGDVSTKLVTDLPGITVVTSAILVRLLIGKKGLTGKYEGKEPRPWITGGTKGLIYNIILGFGFGLVVSGVGIALQNAGVDTSLYPVTCFGIAALGLVFAQTGSAYPGCHHIVLPAATAAVMSGNIIIGALVGAICSVFGDFIGNTFNSYADSHIDPPACTIFISIFIINAIWG